MRAWIAFAVALSLALAAMGWVSLELLRMERLDIESTRQAALEESARLALWRMDSALMTLLAEEGARPPDAYRPRIETIDVDGDGEADFLAPSAEFASPLVALESSYVQLHFEIGPDGQAVAPRALQGLNDDLLAQVGLRPDARAAAVERLAVVKKSIEPALLLAELRAAAPEAFLGEERPFQIGSQSLNVLQKGFEAQRSRNDNEAIARGGNLAQVYTGNNLRFNGDVNPRTIPSPNAAYIGPMTPRWIEGQLYLLRRVGADAAPSLQGALMNWPAINGWLHGQIADLLPSASLVPSTPQSPTARTLASFPIELKPGALEFQPISGMTPIRLSLLISWSCAIVGALGVAALLFGALRLSRRRGLFVSAVSHELRTPLTTFRMYSEMLERGMVADPARRGEYLTTLRLEAERLGHLVENVLAFSRLEHGKPTDRIETFDAAAQLAELAERFADRAARAGLRLEFHRREAGAAIVRANRASVEQIVFNLIDNACKYASRGADPVVRVSLEREGRSIAVAVADSGPGIDAETARRLFQPFGKSAQRAAESAPGVGLGLSLSRRLAREMGGDLRLDATDRPGARFVLTMPAAEAVGR
jgi:signal transduction histidine kinase